MIFTSFQYAAFLTVVVAVNWLLPTRFRVWWLLVASYAFYATWSIPAITILLLTTVVTWAAALAVPTLTGRARTLVTGAAVVVSGGSLLSFKVVEAFGFGDRGDATAAGGLAADFVVPVGLSFFSFQAISYLIDVYREDVAPTRSFVDVATYLAFFPHLLAGPIVRAKKLIPAFHATPRTPNPVQWSEAAELVLVGVFKKVALADPLFSLNIAILRAPSEAGTANVALALVTVLLAGYFDVTGYIDIARGSAKLLGIDMQRNSLLPLTASTGYADFWRRWQLTIMMWFRDYIYGPLRGDGRSEVRDTAALFATFFVLGIWHGLTSGWVAWGIASGVIIVVERTLQTRRAARRRAQIREARRQRKRSLLPADPKPHRSLAIALGLVLLTFPLVTATSLAGSADLYRALVIPSGGPANWDLVAGLVVGIASLLVLDNREKRRERKAGRADPVNLARAAAFGFMVLAVVVYSGPEPQTFVYFHF